VIGDVLRFSCGVSGLDEWMGWEAAIWRGRRRVYHEVLCSCNSDGGIGLALAGVVLFLSSDIYLWAFQHTCVLVFFFPAVLFCVGRVRRAGNTNLLWLCCGVVRD